MPYRYDGEKPSAFARIEYDHEFGHLYVYMVALAERWQIESDMSTFMMGSVLISSQCGRGKEPILYGFDVRYKASSIGIGVREMEIAAKGMRKIHKKLDKMGQELGQEVTYPEYVRRVLISAGVDDIRIMNDAEPDQETHNSPINVKKQGSVVVERLSQLENHLLDKFRS